MGIYSNFRYKWEHMETRICPSAGKWINKLWYIQTMGYYSSLKNWASKQWKDREELHIHITKFSSVVQSCPTLCDPMDCSTPGLPVNHQLPEFTQSHVHWVSDAIQPSHPLSSPSPPAFNHSQHQGLFKWVSSSHQVAKVLEFQPQHQSFQWTLRANLL